MNEYQEFFLEYLSSSSFLLIINDEKQFFLMRTKFFGQPRTRQSQVALSAANANADNDQTDEQQVEPI